MTLRTSIPFRLQIYVRGARTQAIASKRLHFVSAPKLHILIRTRRSMLGWSEPTKCVAMCSSKGHPCTSNAGSARKALHVSTQEDFEALGG